MEGKGTISDYRSKLDKTLASPDLTNEETIHTLVKNQILQSSEEYSEYVVGKRSKELSNFLRMLRSASSNDVERSKTSEDSQGGWKIKQDTDEFRVMYREGPEGTPFHTLLVEGYVDGRVDVCLCISCESDLYRKWWPQTTVPSFRVVSSHCVQKVRTGEQISLVRMKVSWPLSSREALVHYFVFEYIQDGLIVVLLNTIPESEIINISTHGFTNDGIPDAQDVVRIDVVGGFALQKVTADRSYFRTIANMDIKLDFVPPAFINFISRQLIGSGFKLYKKEVASVSKGDEKFRLALKDPLYTRIHEALYSQRTSKSSPISTSVMLQEQSKEAFENNTPSCDAIVSDTPVSNEIEDFKEDELEGNRLLANNEITEEVTNSIEVDQEYGTNNEITEMFESETEIETRKKVGISPEVEQALGILEKAIFVLREYSSNNTGKDQYDVRKGSLINFGEENRLWVENGTSGEVSKMGSMELTSLEHRNSSDGHGSRHKVTNSHIRETNQSKIAPASPDEVYSSPSEITNNIDLCSSMNQKTMSSFSENHSPSDDANSIQGKGVARKSKKIEVSLLKLRSWKIRTK